MIDYLKGFIALGLMVMLTYYFIGIFVNIYPAMLLAYAIVFSGVWLIEGKDSFLTFFLILFGAVVFVWNLFVFLFLIP